MRLRLNFIAVVVGLFVLTNPIKAQLLYEGLIYEGQGVAQLNAASSSDVSPDGRHVYTSSFDDNAVTIFNRNETTGQLTFIESLRNGINGTSGLGGAYDVAVSPDGNHVFVAGSTDHSLSVFSRNSVDGSLTMLQQITDDVDGVDGLQGAYSIAISPDGNTVYVTGSEDNALAVFSRNVTSGMLSFMEVHIDDTGSIANLAFPIEVVVSPDGENVYVTSFDEAALTVFNRNTNTGALSFLEDEVNGEGGVNNMDGAYSVYVSPDGENVYATGSYDNSVVVFNRNTSSGRISYVESHVDDMNGLDGLSGATTVAGKPDGSTIYVVGSNENAIATFNRNSSSGALTFQNKIEDGVAGVSDMLYPINIVISPDGDNMYTSSFNGNAVVSFEINATSGMLSFDGTQVAAPGKVNGLTGAEDMAISADNEHVYIAGNDDDALGVFLRDPIDGSLEFVESIKDGVNGINTLNGVNGVSVSPDGKSVYVTAFWEHTVTVFKRSTSTGQLTYQENHRDGISGVDGLNGSNNIMVSADGKNVYASSFWEHGLAVFSRDESSGALTFQQVLKNGTGGVDGIIRPSSIIESPDQKHIYVTGAFSNAIAIFTKNPLDGTLTYSGVMKDGVNGVNGLRGANSASVSTDGEHIYVAGTSDNGLAVFSRNATTGMLTFVEYVQNGIDNVGGLSGVNDVTVSPDGKRVYTSGAGENAVVIFDRDNVSGQLTFNKMETEGANGITGILGAANVQLSMNGKYIYVAGATSSSVGIFSCSYLHTEDQTVCEGGSVTIAGQTYSTEGPHQESIIDGNCTHMIDFNLSIEPSNYTVSHQMCSGDSYTFNGVVYSTAGQYMGTFTSANGCDSIVTLNLSVPTELNETVDAVICDGESYTIGASTFNTTGVFTETLTASGGCDSIVTLNLTVNTSYTTNTEASICEGEFYTFGNRNYINTGSYDHTFTAANGCDSIVTLQLNVIGTGTQFNESICSGEVYTLGGVDYNTTGSYSANITTSSGCDATVTLNLTVNNVFNESISATICEGDTYTQGSNTYTASGVHTDVFTSSTGCDSTVVLTLNVVPTAVALDETICEGDSYEMGGTSYVTSGNYVSTLTSSMGCGDSTVTLNLTVVPETTYEEQTICEGNVAIYNGNTYNTTGIYTDMIVHSSGCTTEATFALTVLPTPETVLQENICDGDSYTVGSQTYTSTGNYTVVLSTVSGCDSTIFLDLTVNTNETVNLTESICDGESFLIGLTPYTTTGTYTQTISTVNGCDSTVNLDLMVMDNVDASGEITNDSGRGDGKIDLTLIGGTGPFTFAWSNGATTQNVSGLNSGIYSVIITNSNGCSVTKGFNVPMTTSITSLTDLGIKLKLLNNPTAVGNRAQLKVEATESHQLNVRMLNLTGQVINSEILNINAGDTYMNITAPEVAGVYFIHVSKANGQATTLRLVVQ